MVRILVLEDDPNRIADFISNYVDFDLTIAHNVNQANNIVKNNPTFDVMFLDHDIEGDDKSGYDFARNMTLNLHDKMPETIIIHSLNPVGAQNISEAFIKKAIKVPFAWKQCIIKIE